MPERPFRLLNPMVLPLCLVLLALGFAVPALSGGDEIPESETAAVERWIAQLQSGDFREQYEAGRKLAAAGLNSIDRLVALAKSAELDVSVRIVGILEEMYVSVEELEAADRVEAALEELREWRNGSIASRADRVLGEHSDLREKRALARFEELGGQIVYAEQNNGLGLPPTQMVQFLLIGNQWKGGDDGLKYVRRIENLRVLYLSYSTRNKEVKPPVSEDAILDLQAALPQLVIQYRGQAYLGIGPGQNFNGLPGCTVGTVKPGTAAEKAGITPGDIITSFGGKPCPDFDTLIELIKEHGPGDTVKVEVRRPDGPVTLDVTLTGWDASAEQRPNLNLRPPAMQNRN